jgi:hypothetical protein
LFSAYQGGGEPVPFATDEVSSSRVKDTVDVVKYTCSRGSRLCSATWVGAANDFPPDYSFTGKESTGGTHDGIQLAIGGAGTVKGITWIGRFTHEHPIGVLYPGRVVVIGTGDTSGKSELYLYVGLIEADIINAAGKRYVLIGRTTAHSGDLRAGESITASWVEVPNAAHLSSSALQALGGSLRAFQFVRLEDVDYDLRPGAKPAINFVDSGIASVLRSRTTAIAAYGSGYRFEYGADLPNHARRLVLLGQSSGANSGSS